MYLLHFKGSNITFNASYVYLIYRYVYVNSIAKELIYIFLYMKICTHSGDVNHTLIIYRTSISWFGGLKVCINIYIYVYIFDIISKNMFWREHNDSTATLSHSSCYLNASMDIIDVRVIVCAFFNLNKQTTLFCIASETLHQVPCAKPLTKISARCS